jgi:hypothetical protein
MKVRREKAEQRKKKAAEVKYMSNEPKEIYKVRKLPGGNYEFQMSLTRVLTRPKLREEEKEMLKAILDSCIEGESRELTDIEDLFLSDLMGESKLHIKSMEFATTTHEDGVTVEKILVTMEPTDV